MSLVSVPQLEIVPLNSGVVYDEQVFSVLESGTHTTVGSDATVLTDSAATFVTNGVQVGDLVFNRTDGSMGRVNVVTSETVLEVDDLTGGATDDFTQFDGYHICRSAYPLFWGGTGLVALSAGPTGAGLDNAWLLSSQFDSGLKTGIPLRWDSAATSAAVSQQWVVSRARIITSRQTTASNGATSITDAFANFSKPNRNGEKVQVGDVARNVTDGSWSIVRAIPDHLRLTTKVLTGSAEGLRDGTQNDWDRLDAYEIWRDVLWVKADLVDEAIADFPMTFNVVRT